MGTKKQSSVKKAVGETRTQSREAGTKTIPVEFTIIEDGLFLRMQGATATGKFGRVEVSPGIDGSTLITLHRKGVKGSRTYAVSARTLVEMVLREEGLPCE